MYRRRNDDQLRDELERIRSEQGIPGLWFAVSDGGALAFCAALGKKWTPGGSAAVEADVVAVGSISKYFVADLTSVLTAEGAIRPTDRVVDVFPELDRLPAPPPCVQATVDQILHHRGGFPRDHIPWLSVLGDPVASRKWRREQLTSFAAGGPMDGRGYRSPSRGTEPGPETYSNFGYSVLGAMLEERAGSPLEQLLEKKVFVPFGLTTARFGLPNPSGRDPTLPLGHFERGAGGAWRAFVNWAESCAECRSMSAAPSGGLSMTVTDLCRYATGRLGPLRRHSGTGTSVWPPPALPGRVLRGLWRMNEAVDATTGAVGGYRSMMRMDRRRGVAVACVVNANLDQSAAARVTSILESL